MRQDAPLEEENENDNVNDNENGNKTTLTLTSTPTHDDPSECLEECDCVDATSRGVNLLVQKLG